jgi:hypothetical protein
MSKQPDLHGDFKKAVEGQVAEARAVEQTATPASKKQMEDLSKQLGQPLMKVEYTPMGTVVREVRTENDQRIMQQMETIRQKLAARRHMSRDDFNKASDRQMGR